MRNMVTLGVQEYVDGSSMQMLQAKEFLKRIENYIKFKDDEDVLDIGCGPGDTTVKVILPLLPPDANLVGGDLPHMIEYAKKYNIKPRISYRYINIEDPNLNQTWKWSTFDTIFSIFCEHWINDHRQSFSNMYNLLRKDGSIIMVIPNMKNVIYVNREIKKIEKWNHYSKELEKIEYLNEIPLDLTSYYRDLLKEYHFDIKLCNSFPAEYRFPNLLTCLDFCKGIDVVVPNLPQKLVESYMDDYSNICLEKGIIEIHRETKEAIMYFELIQICASK